MTDTSNHDDDRHSGASYAQILKNRPLFYLWLGQLVSRSGDFIFDVAIVWFVWKLTGSTLNVGLTVGTSFLPSVLIAPIAGVYVDRFNRRGLLLISNAVQAGVCGLIALTYVLGVASLPSLLVLLFALNAAGQFTNGAVTAMLPRIVPPSELSAANGLFSVTSSFNQFLGYGLGGLAILALGPEVPILYDGLTFIFALAMISLIPRAFGSQTKEGLAAPERKPFLTSFAEGLSFIRANRILLEIVALAIAVNFFGGAVQVLLAPYATKVLSGDSSSYGFLLASASLGSIAGALVTGRVNVRDHVGAILFGGLIASGALVVLLGLAVTVWAAVAVALALGFFEAALNIPLQVLVQAKIPGTILGRTIGTLGALVSLTVPLAAFTSGGLATFISIPATFELFGGLIVATAAVAFTLFKELRSAKY
jgi:MFS family permease